MAIIDSFKSKKLPIGVFAGVKRAPSPARIFITLSYNTKFEFLRGMTGFKFSPADDTKVIIFEIPVMPPTVQIDFGNSKDTENIARVGEVVLPKYKKATQFRWESFFPYDVSANYLSTSTRNLSWNSLSEYKDRVKNMYSSARDAFRGVEPATALPETYIKIFKILSATEEPFTIAMTFYDGGDIPATKVTLDSFNAEPENNGDYKYNVALIEWTDISPKLLDNQGQVVSEGESKVPDSIKFKQISNIKDFWKWAKQCYPIVSKSLIWAFSTYNGIRNLIFDATLKAWKIKGSLQDLGGRFGILSNMFGLSKITSKDTVTITNSLKKLSFTKASKQMAELIKQNKKYNS